LVKRKHLNYKEKMKKLFFVLTLVLAGVVAMAQPPRGEGGQPPRGNQKEMMLKKAMELGLSADQKSQIEALNTKFTGEEYDRKAYRDAFMAILTDEQIAKFKEMRGPKQGKGAADKGQKKTKKTKKN
jgi:Spy/CpxP family protein refolding chaperone